MEEVRAEIEKVEASKEADLEAGEEAPAGPLPKALAALKKIISPAFIEVCVLTFLAEWGDRSQIATIVLAASRNIFAVTIGAVIGHSLCTALAVVGGRILANRISVKSVMMVGGALFIVFSLVSLLDGFRGEKHK